jgi:hypothetical protein
MSWRQLLGGQVVKHDFDFNRIAVEALIDLRRLYEITDVGHAMWVLAMQRNSAAATMDTDSTERDLTKITFSRSWSLEGKKVVANGRV